MCEWNDVNKSWPPIGQSVLVTNGNMVQDGGMFSSFADNQVRMRWLTADMGEITHWAFKPEPPQQDSEKETCQG